MKVRDAMVADKAAGILKTVLDRAARLRSVKPNGGFARMIGQPERIASRSERLSRQAARLSRQASERPQRRRGRGPLPLVIGGVLGGMVAYFLDPEHGRSRRAQARDRLRSILHRSGRQLNRVTSGMNAQTIGLKHRVAHLRSARPVGDDTTIADRVESAVFRETGLPKGGVSVDVRSGVVVLRGELPRQDQIAAIERATRRIYGVAGVENLLHLPGTPAPHEAERRQTTA